MSGLNRKAALTERLKTAGFSAIARGPALLGTRQLITGFATGAFMSLMSAAVPTQAHESHEIANPERIAYYPGVPGGGSAELINITLPGGKPIKIINAGGLQPNLLADALVNHLAAPKEEIDHAAHMLVYGLTGPDTFDNPAVSASFAKHDTCVIYQHPSKALGLSPDHDFLNDPAIAPDIDPAKLDLLESRRHLHEPMSRVVLTEAERAERETFTFLHEAHHCHFHASILEAEESANAGKDIVSPEMRRVLSLMKEAKRAAKELAIKNPGVDAGKLESIAKLQFIESAADVFGLLATHQGQDAEALRAHAERVLAWRDLALHSGSTHDSADVLLAVIQNAEALSQTVRSNPVLTQAPSVEEDSDRVRGAAFDSAAMDRLSLIAMRFVLDHLASPEMRMRRMHPKEIANREAPEPMNVDRWIRQRNLFQAVRPTGPALEALRERLLARAEANDHLRGGPIRPDTAPEPGH